LRLELPEDFFDSIEDERERVHYRAALDPRATFPELYRQLKVRLHLHLYESSENEPRNYCAVFGYYPVAHGGKADLISKVNAAARATEPHASLPDHDIAADTSGTDQRDASVAPDGTDNLNEAVLVGIVEVGQESEGVVLESIPSVIRLIALNDCPMVGLDSGEVALFGLGVAAESAISLPPVENRKLKAESFVVIGGQRTQLVDEKIERGARVMREVAGNHAPMRGWPLIDLAAQDILGRLRIRLYDKGIGISSKESVDLVFEQIEMFLSPAKFQAWPREISHGA